MGLTMSDGRSMRVDECDGTGITSLIEQSNTPNRSNVVGICFTKCFPIFFNLSSRIFEESFIFSRTPFFYCNPNGIGTKLGDS